MMAWNLPSNCDTVRKSCWLCCSHDASNVPRVDKSDTHWCDTMFVQWLGKKNHVHVCRFCGFFGHFESLAFFENEGTKLTPKQSDRMFSVNLSKVQQLSSNFSKKRGYIYQK